MTPPVSFTHRTFTLCIVITDARSFALLALALAAPLAASQAQRSGTDTTTLQPVVVTATRLPSTVGAATVSATVISGDALRARGISTVQQALEQVPGLFAPRSGSFGGQTSLFLRGGQSDYTQVMIDGVPVNDPGGFLDLANLTTDNVERIEVVRGPSSVLYGANAVTGVVQIFTRDGAGKSRLTASARGGTYGTRETDATLMGGGSRASGSLSVAHHGSDGIYAFNDQSRDNVFSGAFHVAPDTRSTVRGSFRYIDAGAHIPTNSSGAVVDSNQFHLERRWIGSVDAGRLFTDRVEARLSAGATEGTTRSADLPDYPGQDCFCFDTKARTSRQSGDARVNFYATPTLIVTGGASYEWQRQLQFGSAAARRTVAASYAQAVGSIHDAFSYTVGARVDDNSAFGTFTTYRVAGAYRVLTRTRLRASFGTAFKEPTFDQMSTTSPYFRGNPALRPERTRSWEAGLTQQLAGERLTLSATYFNQRFRDVIQYNPAPPTATDPNYINVATANADGVEMEAHLAVAPRWDVAANYTRLMTKVTNAGVDAGPAATYVAGDRLLRRPSDLATLNIGFRPAPNSDRFRPTLSLAVHYVGNRVDIDFENYTRVEAPAYATADLALDLELPTTWRTVPAVALTARVDNLLNKTYQQIYGFQSPGRAVLVGGRVTVGR
jgi:vitamin B12 transporter